MNPQLSHLPIAKFPFLARTLSFSILFVCLCFLLYLLLLLSCCFSFFLSNISFILSLSGSTYLPLYRRLFSLRINRTGCVSEPAIKRSLRFQPREPDRRQSDLRLTLQSCGGKEECYAPERGRGSVLHQNDVIGRHVFA